jgi:hypothetical protein
MKYKALKNDLSAAFTAGVIFSLPFMAVCLFLSLLK